MDHPIKEEQSSPDWERAEIVLEETKGTWMAIEFENQLPMDANKYRESWEGYLERVRLYCYLVGVWNLYLPSFRSDLGSNMEYL